MFVFCSDVLAEKRVIQCFWQDQIGFEQGKIEHQYLNLMLLSFFPASWTVFQSGIL